MATTASAKAPVPSAISPLKAWILVVTGVGLAMGWVMLGQILGAKITIENMGVAMAVYYAILFVPLLVLAWLLGRMGRLSVLRAGDAPGMWAAIGFILGAGGFLVTAAYSWLNGGLVPGDPASGISGLVAAGIALTLVQVGAEEVLFRGWLQPALAQRLGTPAALVVGAAIFAAFHIPAGATSAMSLINLMAGGLWFGLLALRSGGLVAPLMAHFAWNAIEDLGFGLTPNPGAGPLGSLMNWDLLGQTLWGATEAGLNDSIGTTVVLTALILPLLRSKAAQAQPVTAAATV
jgi:hypothetical protein